MRNKEYHIPTMRLGGTFTGLVGLAGDVRIVTARVPSTPQDGWTGVGGGRGRR